MTMTNETATLTIKSPIVELLTNKNDVRLLVNFLDAKNFKSDSINLPVYERLATLLKNSEATGANHN